MASSDRPFRILVVEDSESTLEVLLQDLKQLGYEPRGVSTAEEALKVLGAEKVQLALVDLILPGKGGLWLIGEIQRKFPGVITVLMTANQSVESGVAAANLGTQGYLIKPLKPQELQIAIERARKLYQLELARRIKYAQLAQEIQRLSEEASKLSDTKTLPPPAV